MESSDPFACHDLRLFGLPTRGYAAANGFINLQIRAGVYKNTVKRDPGDAEIPCRYQAHSAPTSLSDNARKQCPSESYALALHRPGRSPRSPHCTLAGLQAGSCDLLKSEK